MTRNGMIAILAVCAALVTAGCGGGSSASSPPTGGSTGTAPTASFSASPASTTAGQTVQFTDTSAGSPTSWSWNFGDGSSSTSQNPGHAYASAGSFTVTLTVSNAKGSSTSSSGVTVAAASLQLSIVLGRPTASSIMASVLTDAGNSVYLEYGTGSGSYASSTAASTATSSTSAVFIPMTGLAANMRYYYRARYRGPGESTYRSGPERTFVTQRPAGSSFTFVIQADPHMDQNSSAAVYTQTLANELADRPDFMIDLGDTSMGEKCTIDGATTCVSGTPATQASIRARYQLMRTFFDTIGHSVPLLMVLGNHDGEAGWAYDANGNSMDAWSVNARKALFANPEPDGFYTGNSTASPGIGLRQNYYAFEWGDVLIVVLDPYTYTMSKPGANGWGWTLGAAQYQWLARTLSSSSARFKLVFSHHLLGGNGTDARGGQAFAQFFEWGGKNLDGSWGFSTQRPGWAAPIHQLFLDNKVNAWFHGHDHLFAKEQVDGVIYQEVPQPSLAQYDVQSPAAGYGYVGAMGTNMFSSSGHLRVTVSASEVKVEYVRSVAPADVTGSRQNGAIVTSYTLR